MYRLCDVFSRAYWLKPLTFIWGDRDQEMSPTRRAAIGAAPASRRLILLPTGQDTAIPHFAPRVARTAERSVVDIAPL
jgi:hypothetical protein